MFEFWNDLMNDKTTFVFTVLIPTFVFLLIWVIKNITTADEFLELKQKVDELEKEVNG